MSNTIPTSAPAASRSPRGFEAVLVIIYGLFAVSATARSLVQILRGFEHAPVAYALSLLAALTYIAVTVLLIRRGRRSRAVLTLVVVELIGVLAVGTVSIAVPALFPDATVWSTYGIGYGFVPLALPLIALGYLVLSRRGPRRHDTGNPRDVQRPRPSSDHVL